MVASYSYSKATEDFSMEDLSKIAIFRALYLGDMLCVIPFVRALRTAYPDAGVTLVGLPWQKEFAARFCGYFNHFIEFPGWPGLPEQQPDAEKVVEFLQTIRRQRFDIVFQMQGNGVLTNSMCMLWGASRVCGLRKAGEYAPDEKHFPISDDTDHEILRFFKLLDCVNVPARGAELEFPLMADEVAQHKVLAERWSFPSPYVCIHPGARDARRRWPVDDFAFIANAIAAQGQTIILTGSIDEKSLLEDLQHRIRGQVINIVETFGHVSAGVLACIMREAALLISNDTGVSHIAAALHVPSVILFSAYSEINRWRPLNSEKHKAIPFEKTRDRDYVLQVVREHMNKNVHKAAGHAATGY
jgi:ADP-heptose:LPS heptosyltransferase